MIIVHFTSLLAYESIRTIGFILTQPERLKRGLSFSFEGSYDRRIGPNIVNRKQINLYDEGLGVFFRILPRIPQIYKKDHVAIIFPPYILLKYTNWFINTTENFGFQLGDTIVESPFSGEFGRTIYDLQSPDITEYSELVIPHSVDVTDKIAIVQSI